MSRYLFPLASRRLREPSAVPKGRRIYAIGDIHGCVSLLGDLLRRIEDDNDARGGGKAELILLGDLIDRGAQSARLLRALHRHSLGKRCRVLRGNHEAMVSDVLAGDHDAAALWLRTGGVETLLSFGVPDSAIDPDDTVRTIALAREAIPTSVRTWIAKLPLMMRAGDYVFVHAGIRPGVPLKRQKPDDLLWIREPFLSSDADHGAIIVHGHTITESGVTVRPNRIGVDTGAYRTGRLSALGLEGSLKWVISTQPTGSPAVYEDFNAIPANTRSR